MDGRNQSPPLPYAEDAEKGLLCSLLLKPTLYLEQAKIIQDHLFWLPANRIIFGIVRDLAQRADWIDFPMLVSELSKIKQLEEVGGRDYLNELFNFVPTYSAWQYYYEGAFNAYRARQAHLAAHKILELNDPDEQAILVEEALRSIAAPQIRQEISFKEQLLETIDWIGERSRSEAKSVIRFGINSLDEALLPIETGDQIVISGDTGGGKSALASQAVLESREANFAIFSLEMHARSLITRMLAAEGNIQFCNLRKGRLLDREYPLLTQAVERLSKRSIWIEDERPIDAHSIAARCRVLKHKGLSAIVVDYLQLVTPSGRGKRDFSREREVAEISRSLKSLALDLGIVVIALSQVNEDGQLRESRTIGQDADIVLQIIADDRERSIQVRKHRNGPRARIPVQFDGACMRFSFPAPGTSPQDPNGKSKG
jgi:replicative DNA helicase